VITKTLTNGADLLMDHRRDPPHEIPGRRTWLGLEIVLYTRRREDKIPKC